jgi:hypothetical protein
MPQLKSAEHSSQSDDTQVELKNGTASPNPTEKSKNPASTEITGPKDPAKISTGLKSLATSTFATTAAHQRALLAKKPEGIQISRSKHWKFISSYHGPYIIVVPYTNN